jgi:mannose-6-phosphate isomerase-like protein (cupin superfamily)
MSYLDQPRINFTGRFFTNVSTINNTLTNYATTSQIAMRPGWNPNGIALFKFDSCTVTGVQSPCDDNKLIGAAVTTPPQPVAGKLVDLDPDEQNLSQIIGVAFNLTTASGAGFQSLLEPCNLQDMWMRAPAPEGNAGGSQASAIYVSTLNSVQWTNADEVDALKLLRDATQNSQLAIRFIVGSYFFADPNDPTSGYGPLVGSIGPYLKGDPVQFARRRLMPPATPAPAPAEMSGKVAARVARRQPTHADFEVKNQVKSQAVASDSPPQLQACNFQLDTENCRLSLDLVNSIPLASFAGPPLPVGQLRAVIVAGDGSTKEIEPPFEFTDDINRTQGGIIDVLLTPDQCQKLKGMRAGVQLKQDAGGDWTTILVEDQSGKFVNISPFTARAVGGDSVTFELQAFQWGKALPNETLTLSAQPTQGSPASLVINDGTDGSGSAVTDENGRAVFTVSTPATLDIPGERKQLDSLVYLFEGPWTSLNGGLFSSQILPAGLVVWSPYPDADMPNPTWEGQVQPIFDEYMRIYPGMKHIMDLTDLSVVQGNLEALLNVLSLPFEAPHMMPVTRDLSTQKIEVIKTWLKNEIAHKSNGETAPKTGDEIEHKAAGSTRSHLFTIAGSKTVVLNDIAHQLRQQIAKLKPGKPQLAEQGIGQQAGVKEALVVVRGHEDPHTHPDSDLIIFVLSGGGYVQLSSGRVEAPVGSTVVIPKGVCHAYHNVSAHDSVLIATFSPTDSHHGVCP